MGYKFLLIGPICCLAIALSCNNSSSSPPVLSRPHSRNRGAGEWYRRFHRA